MGTWGTGIFDNDVALDVQDTFEDALSEGLDVSTASRYILEKFSKEVADSDDGPVVYLALAALQLGQESVQPEIKEKAMSIITSGQDLDRWKEAGADTLAERKQVLEQLKTRLSAVEQRAD